MIEAHLSLILWLAWWLGGTGLFFFVRWWCREDQTLGEVVWFSLIGILLGPTMLLPFMFARWLESRFSRPPRILIRGRGK